MKGTKFILKGYCGNKIDIICESDYPSGIIHCIHNYKNYIRKNGYSLAAWAELQDGREIFLDAGGNVGDYNEREMEAKVADAIKHP